MIDLDNATQASVHKYARNLNTKGLQLKKKRKFDLDSWMTELEDRLHNIKMQQVHLAIKEERILKEYAAKAIELAENGYLEEID